MNDHRWVTALHGVTRFFLTKHLAKQQHDISFILSAHDDDFPFCEQSNKSSSMNRSHSTISSRLSDSVSAWEACGTVSKQTWDHDSLYLHKIETVLVGRLFVLFVFFKNGSTFSWWRNTSLSAVTHWCVFNSLWTTMELYGTKLNQVLDWHTSQGICHCQFKPVWEFFSTPSTLSVKAAFRV